MAKGDAALVLGLAGFVLGGAGVWLGASAKNTADTAFTKVESYANVSEEDGHMIEALGEKVSNLDRSGKELHRRLNEIDVSPRATQERIDELEKRIQQLEQGAPGGAPAGPQDATHPPKKQ